MSANRQRLADTFANLYMEDDSPQAAQNNSTHYNSATTNSGPTTHATTTVPSQSEVDNVWKTLYTSFKITAVTNCPVPAHQPLSLCGCAVGLANMSTYDVYCTKRDSFIRWWDNKLATSEFGAFDYNGDLASHRAFVAKNGKTPLEFAEGFYNEGLHCMSGPSGKKEDMLKAMVEFWIMRTCMWQAKYRNAKEVKDKWFPENYDLSDATTFSHKGIVDLYDFEAGGIAPFQQHDLGPEDHRSVVFLIPLNRVKKGFAVKIANNRLCHRKCPIATKYWLDELKTRVQMLAWMDGRGEIDAAKIRLGTAAEMRKYYGIAPRADASDTELDVLYVV